MNALTRVAIKRAKRVHPEWPDDAILAHVKSLTDAAGVYRDRLTLEDVKDVIASMPEYRPGRLL